MWWQACPPTVTGAYGKWVAGLGGVDPGRLDMECYRCLRLTGNASALCFFRWTPVEYNSSVSSDGLLLSTTPLFLPMDSCRVQLLYSFRGARTEVEGGEAGEDDSAVALLESQRLRQRPRARLPYSALCKHAARIHQKNHRVK